MKRKALAAFNCYMFWIRQLPQMTGTLFAARTRLGRCLKTFLFGVGLVLPLGTLIWAVLFLHGARASGHALPRLSVWRAGGSDMAPREPVVVLAPE